MMCRLIIFVKCEVTFFSATSNTQPSSKKENKESRIEKIRENDTREKKKTRKICLKHLLGIEKRIEVTMNYKQHTQHRYNLHLRDLERKKKIWLRAFARVRTPIPRAQEITVLCNTDVFACPSWDPLPVASLRQLPI